MLFIMKIVNNEMNMRWKKHLLLQTNINTIIYIFFYFIFNIY